MAENLQSLVALLAILLAAFGVGRPLVRLAQVCEPRLADTFVFSLATGLALCGAAIYASAMADCLTVPAISIATLVAGFWGLAEAICALASREPSLWTNQPGGDPPRKNLTAWATPSVVFVVLAGLLTAALAPPTSGAALSELLPAAKELLLVGRAAPNSTAPLLQALHAWALALDGPIGVTLVQWALGALLVFSTVVLARPFLGRHATIAGLGVLLLPLAHGHSSASPGTVPAAAFLALAVAAWWRAAIDRENWRWVILCGVMLVAATAVKPATGTLLPILLASSVVLRLHKEPRLARAQPSVPPGYALAVAVAGIVVCAVIYRGAPRQIFEDLAVFGPVCASLLPMLFVARRLRGLRLLAGAAFGSALLCTAVQGSSAVAALPAVLGIMLAWAWIELEGFPRLAGISARLMLAALTAGVFSPTVAKLGDSLPVALGLESREDYLLCADASYSALLRAARLMQPTSHVLAQDARCAYLPCRVTAAADQETTPRHLPQEVSRQVKSSGCTHVLVAERRGEERPSALAKWVQHSAGAAGRVMLLSDDRFADSTSKYSRVRLYLVR